MTQQAAGNQTLQRLILAQMIALLLKLPLRLAETAVTMNYGYEVLPNLGIARAG
ncbi:MAG TPA: hypothetical protein P5330_04475 [Candidatus Competibacteraceae bacterium]|nr:hypothetical protein [Candidatus Competibacteraceae bacterium]